MLHSIRLATHFHSPGIPALAVEWELGEADPVQLRNGIFFKEKLHFVEEEVEINYIHLVLQEASV